MTYMLPDSEGSFLNRDSRGDCSTIEPGGIHVTQAGSGVKHDEVPTVTGQVSHGMQIWINHADRDRLVAPKAYHAAAHEVPEFKSDSLQIRVIQGSYGQLSSPIELVTRTTLLDVTLQPNSSIELDASEMAFVYIISGSLQLGGQTADQKALVTFEEAGNRVIVHTGDSPANFLFATGKPHNEPIVYGGSFVMTTEAQMLETRRMLQRGEMGVLD